ncbi:MAG: hypothetical protein IJ037_13885 [Clostridia bacterium]|nr:hypothetical protein [Clostridia bacterium]
MRYRRGSVLPKVLAAAVLLTAVTGGILYARNAAETAADREVYTEIAEAYHRSSEEYRELLEITSVENITGLPANPEPYEIREKLPHKEILKETDVIRRAWEELRYAILLARQITAPSEQWVTERLRNVDGITETAAVTKDRDPNGMLGKDGGYTACVYFTFDGVVQEEIPGEDVIAKGTDGGGAVEVYRTAAEARTRCGYLAQFDNTLLYTGSCAVVGTMVIRTSYALTDDEQWLLTDRITRAFMEV